MAPLPWYSRTANLCFPTNFQYARVIYSSLRVLLLCHSDANRIHRVQEGLHFHLWPQVSVPILSTDNLPTNLRLGAQRVSSERWLHVLILSNSLVRYGFLHFVLLVQVTEPKTLQLEKVFIFSSNNLGNWHTIIYWDHSHCIIRCHFLTWQTQEGTQIVMSDSREMLSLIARPLEMKLVKSQRVPAGLAARRCQVT